MNLDLDLYRRDVLVAASPRRIRLSVIDLALEQPPARTILFLHGFGGYARQWKFQLNAFAETSRVVAPDLRGHGLSDRPAGLYTEPDLIGDIESVVQTLGLPERFILAGHSYGGALAVSYALRHPEQIEKLILIATPVQFHLNPFLDAALRLPGPIAEPVRARFPRALAAPAHVLSALYQNAVQRWDGNALLPRVQTQTLVITGHRDLVFRQSTYDRVPELIPHSQRVSVPVSAHLVMLERPDAVNRAIERFIGPVQVTWREGRTHSRAELIRRRPWLKHYEEGVPADIAVPAQPVYRFLETAARHHANRSALAFFDRRISYRAVDQAANRLANALLALGVKKGDRVMLVLPNSPQMVIAYYAVLKAGAVVVSGTPIFTEEELVHQIQDSGAETVITLSLYQNTMQAVRERADVRRVILTNIKEYFSPVRRILFSATREQAEGHRVIGRPEGTTYLWPELLARAEANAPTVTVSPTDLAVLQYTGGTTDVPKGVMLSHANLVANTLQVRHWLSDVQEARERVLGVLPFSHSYGMTACLNFSVSIAGMLILLPSFQTKQVLATIAKYRPTLFPGVPTMYVALNNFPSVRRYGLKSIRACLSGAAPLPLEVQEAFEKLTHGRLVEGYGLTEASPVTHANPIFGQRKTGTIGVPLPSTEARIVDWQTGAEVPPGALGELAIRGPQVMQGYWNRPAETAQALQGNWLATGDVARMDEDGYFTIIDRKKDMILAGALNVYPRDIEEVLYEHPKVLEAVVTGVPPETEQQQIKAYIVLKEGEVATPEEFIEYCRARLAEYAVPRLVEFRAQLPKSFVGKVLRRKLGDENARV